MRQILPVILIALPGLLLVLWPLFRRGAAGRAATSTAPTSADDKRLELSEEKASVYRALKEIEFDYEAGHLSEDPRDQRLDAVRGAFAEHRLQVADHVVRVGGEQALLLPLAGRLAQALLGVVDDAGEVGDEVRDVGRDRRDREPQRDDEDRDRPDDRRRD
ncbi:MAG: hypothetical protein Q8Q58_14320, partial [Candidatus Rokubacteria bacterium]|nr:hypothetical protein [Candidatus Rokubacteria bacterium]